MVREVKQVGEKVLREKCAPVTHFDDALGALLDDMKETVRSEEGAGLAAPQIGVPIRAVVIDVEEGYFELVNPIFVWQKGEQVGREACLSVRDKVGVVRRPSKVKIIFQDRKGTKYSLVARDFFARAVCHELDHLDGILYLDRAEEVRDAEEE